jgi:hypothetical protein
MTNLFVGNFLEFFLVVVIEKISQVFDLQFRQPNGLVGDPARRDESNLVGAVFVGKVFEGQRDDGHRHFSLSGSGRLPPPSGELQQSIHRVGVGFDDLPAFKEISETETASCGPSPINVGAATEDELAGLLASEVVSKLIGRPAVPESAAFAMLSRSSHLFSLSLISRRMDSNHHLTKLPFIASLPVEPRRLRP